MSYQEKKRERRRRDIARMKAKSLRVVQQQNALQFWDESEHCNAWRFNLIQNAIVHAEYMADCSCPGCGNPRKWFGQRTIGELRFLQNQNDEY